MVHCSSRQPQEQGPVWRPDRRITDALRGFSRASGEAFSDPRRSVRTRVPLFQPHKTAPAAIVHDLSPVLGPGAEIQKQPDDHFAVGNDVCGIFTHDHAVEAV